jgi:hypothetical protein
MMRINSLMQREWALRALVLAAVLGGAACNEADGTDEWPGVYPPESEIDRPKGGDAGARDAGARDAGGTTDGAADSASGPGADAAADGDAATDAGAGDGGNGDAGRRRDGGAEAGADGAPSA